MTDTQQSFVESNVPEGENAEFYTDAPKGVIREDTGDVGGSISSSRATQAPQDKIQDHRDIAYTDPHVKEGVLTLLDWIVGDGFNVKPRSFSSAMESGIGAEAADVAQDGEVASSDNATAVEQLRRLLKTSKFWSVWNDWVRYAIVDGHAFMELVVENEQFKPKLLPTKKMSRKEDKFGNLEFYELETPEGGGDQSEIQYEPHEVAELYFVKQPTDDFGRSLIEAIAEQADMLRDMEIDYARFIATKAYPPILWKLGTEDRNWTDDQVESWMNSVENIGPDTMLAAPHDVDTDIVGTTSTSSTSGAMRLEKTFKHFENRVVTGLGVPRVLMNMESEGQGEAVATMPSFKRRISRLQEQVRTATEHQILKSLLNESADLEDFDGTIPEFQFGEHSSAEKRLELDKLLRLFNNGLLTPEAFAERAGLDADEIPDIWNGGNHMATLQALAGVGDNVQNPDGGSPTDTEGGTESAGGEVTSRQDPGADSSNGRNRRSVTEEESG